MLTLEGKPAMELGAVLGGRGKDPGVLGGRAMELGTLVANGLEAIKFVETEMDDGKLEGIE